MRLVNDEFIWALNEVFTGNQLTVYFENFVSPEGFYVVTWGVRDTHEISYAFDTRVDDESEGLDYKAVEVDLMELQQYLQALGYEAHLHIDIKGGYLHG